MGEGGTPLLAVADGVVVRAAPQDAAPALVTLPLGAPVEVAAGVGEASTNNKDWVPVSVEGQRTGWVRHTGLTAAGWQVDLDGDAVAETVTVGFNGGGEVVVRVRSAGAVQSLNLGTREDINGVQKAATVRVMPSMEAGLPLVHVNWSAAEMCGSGDSSAYASFQPPDAGGDPRLQEALRHNGSGGDAPIWWETTVAFEPKSRTVVVTSRSGNHEDAAHDESDVQTLVLVDGVFRVKETDGPVSPAG